MTNKLYATTFTVTPPDPPPPPIYYVPFSAIVIPTLERFGGVLSSSTRNAGPDKDLRQADDQRQIQQGRRLQVGKEGVL